MNYPCAKFGDFSFSRFSFIVWTGHTHTQRDRITDPHDHYTTVGVSNKDSDAD